MVSFNLFVLGNVCETWFMRVLLRVSIVIAINTPLGLKHFMPKCFN